MKLSNNFGNVNSNNSSMNMFNRNGTSTVSGGTAANANANVGKKLVIKPFKEQPRLPDNYEEVSWTRLRAAVDAVFHKTSVAISKEELYQVCFIFI